MAREITPLIADDRPINFIEEIWHYLSPFSAHQIEHDGVVYATVEHAYHTLRFKPGAARAAMMATRSPLQCLYLSRQWREKSPADVLPDFNKLAVMEQLFRTKLSQHPEVTDILKLTSTRGLLKVIAEDTYWGTGPDGTGENQMGKLWMKLRAELQ